MAEEKSVSELPITDSEQLLVGLFHDLYSPVHNIAQCVQFIAEDPELQLSPDGKKVLDFLIKDAKRLQTYFDDTRRIYDEYKSTHLSNTRSKSDQ